jgi:hypothetical protein
MAYGHFAWNELMTDDVETAKKFYAATLGWKYDGMPMPHGTYWIAKLDDQMVGGILDMTRLDPAPDIPPQWLSYVEVENVDALVAKVADAGGKVLKPPFDIPDVGRIAIIADATGAMLGWMTPKKG